MNIQYRANIPNSSHFVQPYYNGIRQFLKWNKFWYLTKNTSYIVCENDLDKACAYDVIFFDMKICIVDLIDPLLSQKERFEVLEKFTPTDFIFVSECSLVDVEAEAKQVHWLNLWKRYEGSVFRPVDAMYSPFSNDVFFVGPHKIWVVVVDDYLFNGVKYFNCRKSNGMKFSCISNNFNVNSGDYLQIQTGGLDKSGVPIAPIPIKYKNYKILF